MHQSELVGRGVPRLSSFRICDSSREVLSKEMYKISLHIYLRSDHYLTKGGEDTRNGLHTLNLQKQLCLKVLEAMGMRNCDGTWKDGADATIYSTYHAFRVC